MSDGFTPGPWRWEHDEDTGDPRVYAMQRENKLRDRLVCVVGHYGDDPDMEANARLIAAAPDLAEALQYITRWLMTDVDALPPHVTRDDVRVYHLDGAVLHNCLERARAALAKCSDNGRGSEDKVGD